MLRIKAENEKLKKESEQLDEKMKNPDEVLIKSSVENQELEKAKDYYLSKNIEIEQLIQQVMNGTSGSPAEPRVDESAANKGDGAEPAGKKLMGQSPEQIESLLRFLIYLVLHKEKMDPEEYKKGEAAGESKESQTERTKKSLLELLKNDESLRQSVFGQIAGQQTQADGGKGTMDRVSDQDKMNLNRFGVNTGPQPF